MADCSSLFDAFNQTIRLTPQRRKILKIARDSLRRRILIGYRSISNEVEIIKIEFRTQGSFAMDTIINPISKDYDLDYGVYFFGHLNREERPVEQAFHNFIIDSIGNKYSDIESVIDKNTCVRVKYKTGFTASLSPTEVLKIDGAFHVDLPSYYSTSNDLPDLSNTEIGWVESNPIEFIQWFESKVNSTFRKEYLYESRKFANELRDWQESVIQEDKQLRRIVRYLKAWCDNLDGYIPPGIVLTILGATNYVPNDRDDLSLKMTIEKIYDSLSSNFVCLRPTTKVDEDLLLDTSPVDRETFLLKLDLFAKDAERAINSPSKRQACLQWQKHFGNRFSCEVVKDEDGFKQYTNKPIVGDTTRSA